MSNWGEVLQELLNDKGEWAYRRNKSVTHTIAEGEYVTRQGITIPQHVSLVAEHEACRTVRITYRGPGNEPVLTVAGGYGGRVSGFEILSHADGVTGILVSRLINGEIRNCRVVLYGTDCVGMNVVGQESITTEKCELRAAVPLIYDKGDNIVFRDMDLGAASTPADKSAKNKTLPSCGVYFRGNPHHVVFDGSLTIQGGDTAILGDTDAIYTGQGLRIENMRYEQSLSYRNAFIPPILFNCHNRGFESFTLINARISHRRNLETVIECNPKYPVRPKIVEINCVKHLLTEATDREN